MLVSSCWEVWDGYQWEGTPGTARGEVGMGGWRAGGLEATRGAIRAVEPIKQTFGWICTMIITPSRGGQRRTRPETLWRDEPAASVPPSK